MTLTNKTVLVAGGGSGIGLAVARSSLERGARVVLSGRSAERLDRALGSLGDLASGERARVLPADISREDEVARLFAAVSNLDHVFVTAASLAYQPIASFSIDDARRVIDSKLIAALLVAKHAPPRMRPGGSITFTSGIAADRPMPRGSMVAAVNGALASFVRAAAIELAPLRVNALSPGWVDTDAWSVIGDGKQAAFAAMAERLPARRIGRPDDMGHAAVFLMESSFTTGTVLQVDGGHRLV